jgi:hypothetical protein
VDPLRGAIAGLSETPPDAPGLPVDAVLLPSPYALSFGGFVNLPTALWLGAGGVVASLLEAKAHVATTCRPT